MDLRWLNEGLLVQLGCIRLHSRCCVCAASRQRATRQTSRFRLIRKIETCGDGKTCARRSQSGGRQRRKGVICRLSQVPPARAVAEFERVSKWFFHPLERDPELGRSSQSPRST